MAFEISEQDKSKIVSIISVLVPEAKIYLFGSRARGSNSQWSDVDLALDAGEIIERSIIAELIDIMAATNLPYKVEIVDLYAVSDLMKNAILQDKKIWKDYEHICSSEHVPNKKTIEAIKNTRERKNIIECKNVEDLFKKLGI